MKSFITCTPSIIRMIKSRRMTWARHVARMGRRGMHMILVGKPEGKRPRRRWVDYIKMDLRWDGVIWTGFIWLGIGTSEHDNEPSGSVKCWEAPE
jgi:hypothetical protein